MSERHDPGPPMAEGAEPPPRGVQAMAAFRWMLLVGAVVVAAFSWWSMVAAQPTRGPTTASSAERVRYQCPMHPQVVSDQPGECPICHMTLVPIESTREMPPSAAPADGGSPPGTVPVTLALDRVQAIGVRTAVATEKELAPKLRITAIVAPTEQGAAEVHVRAPGFVEQIYVDQTGVQIRSGAAMFALYSPDLYQAESELLAASKWGDAGAPTAANARRKLELLGMAPGDIDRMIAKGEPARTIPIYAPAGGYVAKKAVVKGSYVTPELALYEIQDLSRVYVVADVLEGDVARVPVGAEGRFVPASRPDLAVSAKVDLVYPTVNAEARTTRVRMQLANADRALRPGDYGVVEFARPPIKALTVPRDAVVDTGTATYVFVDEGGGRYSPRAVALANEGDADVAVVTSGLAAGDRVVSGATFLIDSESRLQASIAQAPAQASDGGASPPGSSAP